MKILPALLSFAVLAMTPLAHAASAPTSDPAIPTPLTDGQVIHLFPEGVPNWKDIGPETVSGTTYTNISDPRMFVHLPPAGTPQNGTAIIFCPGGGYVHVNAGGSIEPIFNPLGITVFTLIYRCKEFGAPAPQQDVIRAIRLVRAHAAEFGLNPNHIGVLGDSAGSHVAASASTLFDDPVVNTGADLDKVSGRPDFAILLFSVLTMEAPNDHDQSRANLIGRDPTQEMIDHYSLEKHVSANTPPMFLVHSQQDTTVKEENELIFYAALRKFNVPTELHLYPLATHGSGLDANFGPTALWPKLCEEWLRFNGWVSPSPTSLMKVQTNPNLGGRAAGARGTGRGGRRGAAAASASTN
jgi:acetyl esterase/lipase